MLKKKQRLSRAEFQTLLKNGKRVHSEHLTLVFTPGKETKCGLVVSKKIAKQAPKRNKLRRKIYSILGEHLPNMDKTHLVVLTRTGSQHIPHQELMREIEMLLGKSGIKR